MKFSHLCLFTYLLVASANAADKPAANTSSEIPWNQIGAKAGADYKGDGLAVTATDSGARLHCIFQRLDGEATPEGLWLTSTVESPLADRFRVTALSVNDFALAGIGQVSADGQTVRFIRPDLTEEYSVSMDGIRQDFIVEQPSVNAIADYSPSPLNGERAGVRGAKFPLPEIFSKELILNLSVSGANVEPAPDGATLILENSRRRIAYNRLRVTDAAGKGLSARIEMAPQSAIANPQSTMAISIVIDDTDATYPIRIDPTFSDANWVSMGDTPYVNNYVSAAVLDNQGNLYIGGQFTQIGHVTAKEVAKWNGTNWSALGSGMSGGSSGGVYSLCWSGNTLYAGGIFTNAGGQAANCIAQWDGTNWSALGSGISGSRVVQATAAVRALATSGNLLYVGGYFTNAGGILASNIAQWDGTNWSNIGSGTIGFYQDEFVFESGVYALAVSGGTLYAGGYFTNMNGVPANGIAQWDGTSWTALGTGISGINYIGPLVLSLAEFGGNLYVGGDFSTAGGNPASSIAQWDGNNWSTPGSGATGPMGPNVHTLVTSGNTLYAGGNFTNIGGVAANSIAQWDGTNWAPLGSGVAAFNSVSTIAVSSNRLYAGGFFNNVGGIVTSNLAQWDGTNWSTVNLGVNTNVTAFALSGSTLYAATATANGSNYVAQWNGNGWSRLGQNFFFNSPVSALAASSNTLYAGGQFVTGGTNFAVLHYIAQWNGTNWASVSTGLNGTVNTLLISGNTLYAGGYFSQGVSSHIAQWDGTNWSGLSTGLNNYVNALAMSGGILYAGGAFTFSGPSQITRVAQWNGTTWSPVGSSSVFLNNTVNALAVSGGLLYAGGAFTFIQGENIQANYIAVWNGTNWSPLGTGLNGAVNAIALYDNSVYAAGAFSTAGGRTANNIAQWNGTKWSALGSGVNNQVNALALCGNDLYVGGNFTMAGTNYSTFTAKAVLPINISILTTDGNFGFANGAFGFNVTGPSGSNVVVQTSGDLQSWITLQTNQPSNGVFYFSDPQPPSGASRFYRAQLAQ